MFKINREGLAEYSADDLATLLAEGNTALDAALAVESPTAADADEAERISEELGLLQAESDRRTTEASDATARLAALREGRIEASGQSEADAEAEAAADAEPQDGDPEEEQEEEEPVQAAVKKTVVASAPKPVARPKAKVSRPATPPETKRPITITAAADVPEFSTGAVLDDLDALTRALTNRTKGFPSSPMGLEGGQLQRYGVAYMRREHEFKATNSSEDYEIVMQAAKESRLPGGNLIAAGGWCAPSETLYDLCDGETTDGIIDLPEIGVSRGGIRFTPGPQFSTLYAAGFTQTEAQAIAGTTKPCYEVACPTFQEIRLDAMGICIKVPLLTNSAYPELTRRVISGSLTAHLHRVSAGLISKMVTASGTAIVAGDVGGAVSNTLDSVGVVLATLRQEFRLGLNETIEIVLPQWVREAFRADLANRNGVDLLAVSDAQIQSYFSARNARVQWVYNWQDLTDGQEGFPTTFQMMAYPAGTFVKGSTDVINLDAVYDAASLSVNTMTGLFFEEGVLLAQTCFKSKLVTINNKTAGVTGAASNAASFNLVP